MSLRTSSLLFSVCVWMVGCSQTAFFYLEGGEFLGPRQSLASRAQEIELLLGGHYIQPGKNLMLLIRTFDRGSLFAVDDESYEKLTVGINKYEVGVPIKLTSADVKFYYSHGWAGFISRGDGVFSSEGAGEVIITYRKDNRLGVKLDISIFAQPSREKGSTIIREQTVEIKGEYELQEISLEQLTPWLGIPGPSPGSEVYP